jgi:hypothetical protein
VTTKLQATNETLHTSSSTRYIDTLKSLIGTVALAVNRFSQADSSYTNISSHKLNWQCTQAAMPVMRHKILENCDRTQLSINYITIPAGGYIPITYLTVQLAVNRTIHTGGHLTGKYTTIHADGYTQIT